MAGGLPVKGKANPKWITVHLKNQDYYAVVLALAGGILLSEYYVNVLQKFCL